MPKKENVLPKCRWCGNEAIVDRSLGLAADVTHFTENKCPLYRCWFTESNWRTLMQPSHTEEAIRLAWSVVEGTQPHTVSADSLITNLVHLKGMTGERTYPEEAIRKAAITIFDLMCLGDNEAHAEILLALIRGNSSLQTGEKNETA